MISGSTERHQDRQKNGRKSTRKRQVPAIKKSLNTRQSAAIRFLSRYSMLTYRQLAWIMDSSVRTAERAMSELMEDGLICCGGVMPEDYSVRQPARAMPVFSLNRDGVSYVEHHECSKALFDRKPIARAWDNRLIQDDEIRHKLGIVDCMIALSKSVDTFTSLEVVYMAPDFVKTEDSESINKEAYKGGSLIPDIIVSVLNNDFGSTRDFYIEYDRGNEPVWMSPEAKQKAFEKSEKASSKRAGRWVIPIADRFANYNQFFAENGRATSSTNPSILWVCESDEALRRIRSSERIQWQGMANIIDRMFLSTIGEVSADFLGEKWHPASSDELASPVHLEKLGKVQ